MHVKILPILVAACFVSMPFSAVARAPFKLRLIEQKPTFDTSVLPIKHSPFKIQLKHTEIIYPQDPSMMLHAQRARVVRLTADENSQMLRAKVTTTVRTTSISTVEHGMKPRFRLDLLALLPKIAPDISRQLDAQMADSQRKLAARLAADVPLMDQQLKAQRPKANVPDVPGNVPRPDLAAQIDASRVKVPVVPLQQQNNDAGNEMQAALARAKGGQPMLGIPGGGSGSGLTPGLQQAAKQMQAQMNAAKKRTVPTNEVDARLNQAKQRLIATNEVDARLRAAQQDLNGIVNRAKAQMDAITTEAHRLPPPVMPTTAIANFGEERVGQKIIPWDAWHANFGKVAGAALLKAVNKAGNPSGVNVVSVKVLANHHLKVDLAKPSNPAFDKAILEAYRSLDGQPSLEYPAGSLRQSVTFLVDNKHAGNGVAGLVNSKTIDDKEVQDYRN